MIIIHKLMGAAMVELHLEATIGQFIPIGKKDTENRF